MRFGGVLTLAVLTVATGPVPVLAEGAGAAPAEMPPAAYAGRQYVDSAGCVFTRVEKDGAVSWEARVDRDNKPLCGYAPTQISGNGAEAAADTGLFITGVETVPGEGSACPEGTGVAHRYLLSDGRSVLRCGADTSDPVAFINGAHVAGLHVAGLKIAAPILGETVAPEAAPAAEAPEKAAPVSGAEAAGPENAAEEKTASPENASVSEAGGTPAGTAEAPEGEEVAPAPETETAPAAPAATEAADHATIEKNTEKAAEKPVVKPAEAKADKKQPIAAPEKKRAASTPKAGQGAMRYVQIGAFTSSANVVEAEAQLRKLGLPVSRSKMRLGGKPAIAVMAGPFASREDLAKALSAVRHAGFRDAYLR